MKKMACKGDDMDLPNDLALIASNLTRRGCRATNLPLRPAYLNEESV